MRAGSAQLHACPPGNLSTLTLAGTTGTPLVVARPGSGEDVEIFINRGGTSPFEKFTYNDGWSGNGNFIFTPAGIGNLVGLFVGADFAGGGGGGIPVSGFVTLFQNGVGNSITGVTPSRSPSINPPTGDESYSPVSVGAGYLYGGTGLGVLRRFAVTGNQLTGARDEVTGLGDISKTTPLLGKGGLVYVVSLGGSLRAVAFSGTTGGSVAWEYPALFTADGVGQPALDVVRDSSGSTQCARGLGVLYVPSVFSGVASVTAVIVDSPGLDPTAPWPKYQRDNRNSGFADSSSPAACP